MRYRTFLLWNLAGGAVWATSVVVAGYMAGKAWRTMASAISRIGWIALGVVVIGLAVAWWWRRRHRRP